MRIAILILMLLTLLLTSCNSNNYVSKENESVIFKFVSGTEYFPKDDGQVIVELRDKQYNPINASCYATVLYPNKSLFINHKVMNSSVLGTFFYNFTVPKVGGVYEYSVNCTYQNKNFISGKSFHVSKRRMKSWIEH